MTTPAARPRCQAGAAASACAARLCLSCNIALGYIEAYSELATGYLRQHYAGQSPQPAGHSGLTVLRGEEADLVVNLQQESH